LKLVMLNVMHIFYIGHKRTFTERIKVF